MSACRVSVNRSRRGQAEAVAVGAAHQHPFQGCPETECRIADIAGVIAVHPDRSRKASLAAVGVIEHGGAYGWRLEVPIEAPGLRDCAAVPSAQQALRADKRGHHH